MKNYYFLEETNAIIPFEKILFIADYTDDKFVITFANGVNLMVPHKYRKEINDRYIEWLQKDEIEIADCFL